MLMSISFIYSFVRRNFAFLRILINDLMRYIDKASLRRLAPLPPPTGMKDKSANSKFYNKDPQLGCKLKW